MSDILLNYVSFSERCKLNCTKLKRGSPIRSTIPALYIIEKSVLIDTKT
jgi:hypothetical protein